MGDLVNELLTFRVVGDRLAGRSPNLIDALAMHTEFMRSSIGPKEEADETDKDEPEYGWMPVQKPVHPYGLNEN